MTVSWTERLLRYFYCFFTLMIAVLPCFKQKNPNFSRALPLTLTGRPRVLPRPPAVIFHAFDVFFVLQKTDASIFFLYYPLIDCLKLTLNNIFLIQGKEFLSFPHFSHIESLIYGEKKNECIKSFFFKS